MPTIQKSQAAVVAAATRQTMKMVTDELDLNKDKKLDDTELNALMTAIDSFNNGGGPPSTGALPAEKTRMQMAVMQTLSRMGDDPKFQGATTVKLSDLRVNMKKTFDELLTTAKKVDDGGLMNGLGGLMTMVMMPDVAVKHVQQTLLARDE